jgi:hypothetical protein
MVSTRRVKSARPEQCLARSDAGGDLSSQAAHEVRLEPAAPPSQQADDAARRVEGRTGRFAARRGVVQARPCEPEERLELGQPFVGLERCRRASAGVEEHQRDRGEIDV